MPVIRAIVRRRWLTWAQEVRIIELPVGHQRGDGLLIELIVHEPLVLETKRLDTLPLLEVVRPYPDRDANPIANREFAGHAWQQA